ncbi:hypothetical protein AQUCO_05800081v1 [Aquilegia coerulea]|uniref:Uncharacterized protein n=1 Tax=Aquilegia coerulea TaxID=218851 RepID=A0A2G5CEK0_AQUCA|nr:hypothetical protein AQUCO_05800081v1 [Aquilegia coerulea]
MEMEEQYRMITKTTNQNQNPNPNPSFLRQEDHRSDLWLSKKKKNQVFLEGYVESNEEEDQEQGGGGGSKSVSRTVSLTDEDLDELKGCVDLGFGFNYEEIPELCNTLPALELCYSMSQRFLDEQHKSLPSEPASADASSVMATDDTCSSSSNNGASQFANWKISSPGDHPEEVKARLKYWAQAVACTVKLCS